MKRIEPGMLCLVVSGTNAGRECTAVRFIERWCLLPECDNRPCDGGGWLINGPSIMCPAISGLRYINGFTAVKPDRLLPISGGDKLEDLETAEDLEATA